jgi:hypothetical protein
VVVVAAPQHLVHKQTQLVAAVAVATAVVARLTVVIKVKAVVTGQTFQPLSVSQRVILIAALVAVVAVRCWVKAAWVAAMALREETVETVRAVLTVLVRAVEVTQAAAVVELVGQQVAAQFAVKAQVAALESST